MAPKSNTKAAAVKLTYKVDFSKPAGDGLLDAAEFEKYLHDRIKVDGKPGQLGEVITLKRDATKITLTSTIPFSKRYLKYLTKKYLQKSLGGGFMRVISSSKDTYTIVYPNVAEDDNDEEEVDN